MSDLVRDLTEEEARLALPEKWGRVAPDVLPAWVAEMDYAVAPVISDAVAEAARAGAFGYPRFAGGGALGTAYAGFAARRFGQQVDPRLVLPVVDVTAGFRLALDVLCEAGGVVVPLPSYPPMLAVPAMTGRERVDVPLDPDAPRAELDLDGIERGLRRGARTVLLINPHNPWGRAFSRSELEGLRDVVVRHGARVVSDEIHAPVVLPGSEHVPYLSLPGTADHAVALVSASKAFNLAGLRCAQILAGDAGTRDRLLEVPEARNDSWSTLGVVAAEAAYSLGDPWLDALLRRLDGQRALLGELLAEHLPHARMRPLEATYLVWLDLRAYDVPDAAEVLLAKGRVRVIPGHDFEPGRTGHVRVNIATSPARLTEIVRRMADALAR